MEQPGSLVKCFAWNLSYTLVGPQNKVDVPGRTLCFFYECRRVKVSEVTEQFILRRTNRLNARFLPPKQLFNVFVKATGFQNSLYKRFLRSNVTKKLLESDNMKMNRTVLSMGIPLPTEKKVSASYFLRFGNLREIFQVKQSGNSCPFP